MSGKKKDQNLRNSQDSTSAPSGIRRDFYPGDIPAKPGIYIFRDRFSRVIYVGKATNLRRRMSSYFQPSRQASADPKLRSLIKSISAWEYHVVKNESESLILEAKMIKEYSPRYNVLLRDDKRFLMIRINLNEPYPTLYLARLRKNDGSKYFGPFPQGTALRRTVEFLIRRFGLRACRSSEPSEQDRKHCLARIVKDCCEPCTGKTPKDKYRKRIDMLMSVLNGNIAEIICELRKKMDAAVEKLTFEKAAEFRDMIENIETILGHKNRQFKFAKTAGAENAAAAIDALKNTLGLPRNPWRIDAFDISNISGSLSVASMVCFINGRPDTARYRRFRIKAEIQSDASGEKKVSQPAAYPYGKGGNDFAMMKEAVSRRYSRVLKNGDAAEMQQESGLFPDLILIDGGKGQLNAALTALKEIDFPITPVIGLAKKNEEVFVPGRSLPIILDRHSPALKLLQSIRDESHRFAVAYHRKLRDARIEDSILDQIEGIGPARKKSLLKAFGSVRKLRIATPQQITAKVPGIGAKFAEKILREIGTRSIPDNI